MFKKVLTLPLLVLSLAACQTTQDNPNATKGAGIGAAAGAAVGAIIGHQTGKRNEGALIGATLGGGLGGVVGHRMDKQAKELERIAETKRTDQGLVTKLKSDILFDTGKADLKPAAKSNISQLAAIMKKYPENVLTVRGYTDSTGSNTVNGPLSEKRAKAVQARLVEAGIPAATVSSIGMGSANPIEAGMTKEALAKNRRVEIEVTVDESKVPESAKK